MTLRRWIALSSLVLSIACTGDRNVVDAGDTDSGANDTGTSDSGVVPDSGEVPDAAFDLCAASSCDTCPAGCGWCESTGRCALLEASGRPAGECTSGWKIDSCEPCDQITNSRCDLCGRRSDCVWCWDESNCQGGGPEGPASRASCAGYWSHGVTDFVDCSREACLAETTCGDCTAREVSIACGWCEGDNACVAGSSEGPGDQEMCSSGWTWFPANCR